MNSINFKKFLAKVLGAAAITALILTFLNQYSSSQTWMHQMSGTERELNSVFFTTPMKGWVVGNEGTALFTVNGGMNWYSVSLSEENLNSVAFADQMIGLIVGNHGIILRTTNSGLVWYMVNSGTDNDLNTVSFGDGGIAYTAGKDGAVLTSSDFGFTWNQAAPSGSKQTINGSAAKGNMDVWFAGDNGLILASVNRADTLDQQMSRTDRDLMSVFFINNMAGFIGGKNETVLYTADGGMNWVSRNFGINQDVNDVFFLNLYSGFAVGEQGTIYRTSDIGMNWMAEMSNTTRDLHDVFFTDASHGWAVGDSGVILFRGVTTGIRNNNGNVADRFNLLQNYPNPFNPSTVIKFELPQSAKIKLSVYDVSGKVVKELADGFYQAGAYSFDFNASNLSSGIYFYRLQTPNFTDTKRMVLIK